MAIIQNKLKVLPNLSTAVVGAAIPAEDLWLMDLFIVTIKRWCNLISTMKNVHGIIQKIYTSLVLFHEYGFDESKLTQIAALLLSRLLI